MGPAPDVITSLLAQWREGDQRALQDIMPLLYNELHRLAGGYLRRERQGHTLQATALVNEAYVRLAERVMPAWQNRAHFIAVSAQLMRQILVDHSRGRRASKRGSGRDAVELSEDLVTAQQDAAMIALDDALAHLAAIDPRKAKMIEMRHFGGLTGAEIACVLDVSTATVTREMRLAEAWLASELGGAAI